MKPKKLFAWILALAMAVSVFGNTSAVFAADNMTGIQGTDSETIQADFSVTPEDAYVCVIDDQGDRVWPDSEGKYTLNSGSTYDYTVTKSGYEGKSGQLVLSEDTTTAVELTKAAENTTINKDISAYWKNFRNDDNNMAVVDVKTPQTAQNTELKWAKKLGTGYSASPSVQIIVDDKVITISGTAIYKLDPDTGDVLQQGSLVAATNWGYTPPTYADGIIFCPLSGGRVQAVNAKTLESLWVYTDKLGGQSLSAITYKDGYVYTGFWNSETNDANFVCLSATDEDPENTTEAKTPTWTYKKAGGFYWAGSIAIGDAIIVGTDDGESGNLGTSHLLAMDRKTGEIISDFELKGDQRSCIAYDVESGRIFGTTKAGYLFSAAVDETTGKLSDLKTKWYGKEGDSESATMSTSTPVVYKGVAYIGYTVSGNFGGSGYTLLAADADTLEEKWRVPLIGYPQGSALLSTAYEEEDGNVYIYMTYNNKPGGITLIKAKPDASSADEVTVEEIYDAKGYEQYCITSLICDANGTIYYKNDSGNIFAVGRNDAYLDNIEAEGGSPVFSETFAGNVTDYEVTVAPGTKWVTLVITRQDNQTVAVNGEPLTGTEAEIRLSEGSTSVEITAVNGEYSRTYHLSIRERNNDASLNALEVNESNAYSSFKTVTPEFDSSVNHYAAAGLSSSRTFTNIWPASTDANASVKVYAVSGVSNRGMNTATGEINITAVSGTHNRYAIYWDDTSNKAAVVRVEVTAEDKKTVQNYYLLLTAEKAVNLYSTDGYFKYDREQMETLQNEFYAYMERTDIYAEDLLEEIQKFNAQADSVKAFQDTKAQALSDLTPEEGVYRDDEQAEVDIILRDVKRQLQTISSEEDLAAVIDRASLDISRIKTDAELTEEENKATLTIGQKTVALINDQTYQLTVKATSDDPELKCVFTSSNEDVATVDAAGKITAISGGIAFISVTYGDLEEFCVVQVKQETTPESVTVVPEENKINDGKTNASSSVTHFYVADAEEQTTIKFSAENEKGDKTTVTWKSDNSKVPVSDEGLVTVPANVTSSIYVRVTATSIHDSSVKTEYGLYILPELSIASSYQDKVLTLPENGIAKRQGDYVMVNPQMYDTYNLVKWTIEDDSIAEIDDSGNSVCYVYPKKAGTTKVTVTDINHPENTATTTITVKGFVVADEDGNTGEGYANIGDTVTLTARTEDDVTWTTSDGTVASVDETGAVKALSKGQAVITAVSDNGKCSYTLNVGETGKVYPTLLYTSSYSSLYTDAECTKTLDYKAVYTNDTVTYTSNVHVFPATAANDIQLYAKQGNSNLTATFGMLYDAEKMKAELIEDGEVTANITSGSTAKVTIKGGTNKFTIRVTSLTDEKNYTDYNFTVIRALSSTSTLSSSTVAPYERSANTTKKYYSALAKKTVTEGTLFRAEEDGTPTATTGFNASYYNYRAYLYSDAETAKLTIKSTDTVSGHIAYSVDNGQSWTENVGTVTTEGIGFDENNLAKVIVKCVSDSEYTDAKAAETDPYATAVTYTYWIERMDKSFDAKTTIHSLSFDENCTECSPNFYEGASMAAALVAHDQDTATIQFTADRDVNIYKASVSESNRLTAVSSENGISTYEMEISVPLKTQGNQVTQTIVASYTDEESNRIDQNYTVYFFKIGTTNGVLKGTPDKIVDYMCIGSQYTSGGNTGWGIYGVFPEKIFMGAGNWSTCISIGNFGGYMTFYYEKPIIDDENNPYGVDFTVFGNSNGGASFSEPGNVLVSEDGKTWYTLAGSEHYDETSRWDYEVTYKNVGGLAYYSDNDGNGGDASNNNSFGNMKYPTQNCYPLFDWQENNENEITISGTRLYGSTGKKGDGLEIGGNGALPAFGYADVHTNSSTVGGTGEDVDLLTTPVGNPYMDGYNGYGDGFDLKWAVDKDGNPVDVSDMEFHYVKVQTASFINGGAIGEKSTEVSSVVRTSPASESAGATKAPESITVGGKEITLSEDKNVYYASVEDESDYTVTVTPASEETNVYINNQRATSRDYDSLPDKGIVRVIVQEGSANPVIYYIHVTKAGTATAENVMASIDALGEITVDSAEEIADVRAAYEALSQEEKDKVSNLNILTAAESRLAVLQAEAKIAAAENAQDKAAAYEDAKKAYDALTDEQKAELTDAGAFEAAYVANIIARLGDISLESESSLKAARNAYNALSKENQPKVANYQTLVNAELVYENLVLKKDLEDADSLNKSELAKLRFAMANCSLSKTSFVYNGKERKPAVNVTSEGKTLKKDADYTVTYKDNKNVGTATVTIEGKGNYSGTKTLTFTINPKATSIKALKKGKKKIRVTWKKAAAQVSGYQIMYATNKKFTKGNKTVTVSGISKKVKIIKKLTSKKKYYVKIRTYKTVNGVKYYSSWSKAKFVKTK